MLAPAILADLPPGLHPSARLLDLSWPVHEIWQRHRSGRSIGRDPGLAAQAQSALVWRPYGEVRSVVLDPGSACFLARLNDGKALASASEYTLARYPDFDPAAAFGAALSAGYLFEIWLNRCVESLEVCTAVTHDGFCHSGISFWCDIDWSWNV